MKLLGRNIRWLDIVIVTLIWAMNFFDDDKPTLWHQAFSATIITTALVGAFTAGRYYLPQQFTGKFPWVPLITWHLTLSIMVIVTEASVTNVEPILEEEGVTFPIAVLFLSLFVMIYLAIAMVFSWTVVLFERNKENELAIAELTALNKESELSELKSQLNPHFLFNALSNIYSIAYLGDKRTPEKIMQLSKMLRYVIYDTDVQFISLNKEIDYLNYYIDFQKFRIKKEQQIEFDYDGADSALKIAPLLLLPFVENSFKHSQVAIEQDAWVKVELKTADDSIHFRVENTISHQAQPEILDNHGIGLENIKKRLTLIYKDDYSLSIQANDTFLIDLKIKSR